MNDRRDHRWANRRGMAGGFAMFFIEALVVAALVGLGLIVSLLVLTLL